MVVCAAALNYLIVATGVPLPVRNVPAKSGELFPCASSGCGCDSVERCWSGCCCHTLSQRLAWAEEHGARPPDFALAAAREAGLDTSRWDNSPKCVNATFATAKKPACCAKRVAAASSCCSKKATATAGCCSSKRTTRGNDHEASRSFIGWRALACRGQSLHWLAAVPAMIAFELELADEFPLIAWLGPPSSVSAASVADVPTPPPPERV